MSLIAIQPLGRNRDNVRLWIESRRLAQLGFTQGTPLEIQSQSEGLTLRPAVLGENHVSSRVTPGGRQPIIDLANQSAPKLQIIERPPAVNLSFKIVLYEECSIFEEERL